MNRPITFLIFLFLFLFLYAGCERSNGKEEANTEKIPVEISLVELGELSQSLQYNGDICAEYEVKVFSKIPDRIEKFFVEEGEFIKKGSPVARVLAVTIEQAVRQAEAGLIATRAQEANLKLEYDRANRLYKESAMSQHRRGQIERAPGAAECIHGHLRINLHFMPAVG